MNNTKFKYIIVALIAFTGKACYCAAWNPGTQPNMGDQQMATTTERHALESLAGQIVDAAEREDQEEIFRLANVAIAANIATKKDIFDQIPAEVIEKVAISLPPKSWVRMSLVSRTFKRFIRDWPLYQFLNPYLNHNSGELTRTLYNVKNEHPDKIEVINYLHQHIPSIDIPDIKGDTPLTHAIYQGNHEKIADLLKKGANPNVWINTTSNPLLYCIESGNGNLGKRKIIKLLVDGGADVNGALKLMIDKNKMCEVRELIPFAEINWDQLSDAQKTRLEGWYVKGYIPLLKGIDESKLAPIMELKQRSGGNIQDALRTAIINNEMGTVGDLLRFGADPNYMSEGLLTNPLWTAAMFNKGEMVKQLIKAGADSTATLKVTICTWDKDIAKILINNGADTSNLTNEEIQQLQKWDLLPDLGGW